MSVKKLFEKVEMKQEPVTGFENRKVDHGFLDSLLCGQMFERLTK